MTLRWADTLPLPQVASLRWTGAPYAEVIDVLNGPTRIRLTKRHATGLYEFEVWFSADQAEDFEDWYNEVIALHDGEWYAPWIGEGRVLAFIDEYQMAPQGLGWAMQAVVTQTRIDVTLCDEHISAVFGDVYRDDGVSPDLYVADLAAADIYIADYPLELIASEPC